MLVEVGVFVMLFSNAFPGIHSFKSASRTRDGDASVINSPFPHSRFPKQDSLANFDLYE